MRLTFPNGEHPAVALEEGELGIGSGSGNGVRVQGAGLAQTHARLVRDAKGVWLRVPREAGPVHVNARPVHALAMLRPGDLLCLGHLQVQVCLPREASVPDDADEACPPRMAGVRVVLRGVSGTHSGRSFSLSERLVLGGGAGADVHLDDPASGGTRVELSMEGARVVLRQQAGEAVEVNGLACREAVLAHGDQVKVEQQRFVLEAPGLAVKQAGTVSEEDDTARERPLPPRADPASMIWWLIAAASTLAAIITALLLYGPGRG